MDSFWAFSSPPVSLVPGRRSCGQHARPSAMRSKAERTEAAMLKIQLASLGLSLLAFVLALPTTGVYVAQALAGSWLDC